MSNYNVEELNKMFVNDLRGICKNLGLYTYKGKKALKKQELIDQIIEHQNVMDNISPVPTIPTVYHELENCSESVNGDVEVKQNNNFHLTYKVPIPDKVVEAVNYVEPLPDPETFCHTKNKDMYIKNAEVGTLMAFLDENGKPRTGKLVNRSTKRKVVKLVTEFGWEFIVSWEKVMWVRNEGSSWPRGIYRLLKEWKNANRPVINKQG